MSPVFSSTRLSLINRDIIWVTAHIRGGMEKGMKWWKEGKLTNKKNTFKDYIYAAKYLIENKYSSEGKIIGMGGSAGGLLMGAVVNEAPELFPVFNFLSLDKLGSEELKLNLRVL